MSVSQSRNVYFLVGSVGVKPSWWTGVKASPYKTVVATGLPHQQLTAGGMSNIPNPNITITVTKKPVTAKPLGFGGVAKG
jgi:hypothetical protein